MEGAGCNEQNVIGFHHPVFRLHIRAFHDREKVALDALTRNVRASAVPLARDLVYLIEKDDAHRLDALERIRGHVLVVDELVELLLEQDAARLRYLYRSLLRPLGKHFLQHVGEISHSLRRALRHHHVEHHRRRLRHLDLDLALFQLAIEQELTQLVPRALVPLLLHVQLG